MKIHFLMEILHQIIFFKLSTQSLIRIACWSINWELIPKLLPRCRLLILLLALWMTAFVSCLINFSYFFVFKNHLKTCQNDKDQIAVILFFYRYLSGHNIILVFTITSYLYIIKILGILKNVLVSLFELFISFILLFWLRS